MHLCTRLLDEAFALADREEEALRHEHIEQAEALFLLRQRLLDEIWEQKASFNQNALFDALSRMLTIQERLTAMSDGLKAKMHDMLQATVTPEAPAANKQQVGYLAGYKSARSELEKSVYCSTRT